MAFLQGPESALSLMSEVPLQGQSCLLAAFLSFREYPPLRVRPPFAFPAPSRPPPGMDRILPQNLIVPSTMKSKLIWQNVFIDES